MITKVFPFIEWFKDYSTASLKTDIIAGLTVALVLIPQSMAYAQLAGLPAYYGLYASFLPPMFAALFGSSRQLATGPVAMVSLMTAACLEPLATAGSSSYISYAILLALMVGAFQFALGVLRLGLVVNFLSHPVVNGFMNAGALIIASSQLPKLFGVSVDKAAHEYETVVNVIQSAIYYTHWPTLLMGIFAFVIMYGLKIVSPRIPNVLVAVVFTTLISWATGFEHNQFTSLSAIQSQSIVETVRNFNIVTDGIASKSKERTRKNQVLADVTARHDSMGIINARHELEVLNHTITRLKEDAGNYRAQLRLKLLKGVPQSDGSFLFYPEDELPQGVQTDGRTWRLKVGNNPLQEDKLMVMGGGQVVGAVPKGLPPLSVPELNFDVMAQLIPFAIIISLLGFMEAISVAKSMAAKTGQRLDPNQELIGQGIANLLGAVGQSYPTSGSFSRSAVNLQAGAGTGLSCVFTSLMVVIMLLFFTPLLYHLPQSVLAAVIMMAVIGLLNVSGFIHALKAKWYDGVISIITFVATLAFAPYVEEGIILGVVFSLLVFLYNSMRPGVVSLARTDDDALRCVSTHCLNECDHVAMVRFDSPLFFANASYLEDKIMDIMREKKKLKHIVLVSNGINDIDASGEETLALLVDRIRSAGVDISLSGVNETVMNVLKRTHFSEKIGEDHIFTTMEKAIDIIHPKTHHNSNEEACPLLPSAEVKGREKNKLGLVLSSAPL